MMLVDIRWLNKSDVSDDYHQNSTLKQVMFVAAKMVPNWTAGLFMRGWH
jgi:hypothetical protein